MFRWEELEKICHYLAGQHLEQFTIPLLLMYRFAPITKDDDKKAIAKKIEAAWRSLGLFSELEINELRRTIYLHKKLYWKLDEKTGWYCDSDDGWGLYSLRVPENKEFPFKVLQEMLQFVEQKSDSQDNQLGRKLWDDLIQKHEPFFCEEQWFKAEEGDLPF